MRTNEVKAEILRFMADLEMTASLPLDWDMDFEIKELFKLLKVGVKQDGQGLTGSLLQYMEAMRTFCGARLFLFFHLKSYLEPAELESLYQDIRYRKLTVLLVESRMSYRLPEEKTWIVDKDLCAIY